MVADRDAVVQQRTNETCTGFELAFAQLVPDLDVETARACERLEVWTQRS
jgi:hypothetical protein